MRSTIAFCVAMALATAIGPSVRAASLVYDIDNGGAAAFSAAVSGPVEEINFDDLAASTDISSTTILGVSFNSPAGGAPLLVVDAAATFTPAGFSGVIDASANKLPATTGARILSPGGAELAPGLNDPLENDDVELLFDPGVIAFGFDHLSQSADGISFTVVEVFNQVNDLLFSGVVPITDNGLGGEGAADFWGIVTSGTDVIRRVVIDERDDNTEFPDANIGLDSIRFQAVPEPASVAAAALTGFALLAIRSAPRRKATR